MSIAHATPIYDDIDLYKWTYLGTTSSPTERWYIYINDYRFGGDQDDYINQTSNDKLCRAWIYTFSDITNKKKKSYCKIKTYYEINISKKQIRVLTSVNYNYLGNIIKKYNPVYPNWDYITPDTMGESIYDFCNRNN
jgi:hypothetical protein